MLSLQEPGSTEARLGHLVIPLNPNKESEGAEEGISAVEQVNRSQMAS